MFEQACQGCNLCTVGWAVLGSERRRKTHLYLHLCMCLSADLYKCIYLPMYILVMTVIQYDFQVHVMVSHYHLLHSSYTLQEKMHLSCTFKHLFWCSCLSQIGDSIQYLEGQISIWKTMIGILGSIGPQLGVLPGTIWSFRMLISVLYLWQAEAPKKVLGSTFFLRV